jgi:hypothetical protein
VPAAFVGPDSLEADARSASTPHSSLRNLSSAMTRHLYARPSSASTVKSSRFGFLLLSLSLMDTSGEKAFSTLVPLPAPSER